MGQADQRGIDESGTLTWADVGRGVLDNQWIYLVGSVIGMVLGGFAYQLIREPCPEMAAG